MLNLDSWKKAGIYIGVIVGILTIFHFAFSSFSWMSNKHQAYTYQRDLAFSGTWTNPTEGCIDCEYNNDPKKPIVLELIVNDGYINGALDASGWLVPESLEELNNKLPNITFGELEENDIDIKQFLKNDIFSKIGIKSQFGYLNINGKLNRYSANIEIWDFVNGKRVLFGQGKLNLQGNVLDLKMFGRYFAGIPSSAELFKTFDAEGNTCKKVNKSTPYICMD